MDCAAFPIMRISMFDCPEHVHGGQSWWGDNTVEYAWYWDDCLWPWSVPQGELQRNASLTTRPGWVY